MSSGTLLTERFQFSFNFLWRDLWFQTSQRFKVGIKLFPSLTAIQFGLNQISDLLIGENTGGLRSFYKFIWEFQGNVHDKALVWSSPAYIIQD